MTAILVATLGTRDLMFQISSGLWYSIGDFIERVQVINDLGLDEKITHRDLTQYLSDRLDRYLDRIKPVIMGKLLTEQATQTEQMYPIYSKPELPGIGANFMYFRLSIELVCLPAYTIALGKRSSYHKPNRSICDPHTKSLKPNVLVGSLDRLLCLGLRRIDRDSDDSCKQVFG